MNAPGAPGWMRALRAAWISGGSQPISNFQAGLGDQIGLGEGDDEARPRLDLVRVVAGAGQRGDGDAVAADAPCQVGKLRHGSDDGERLRRGQGRGGEHQQEGAHAFTTRALDGRR